jgi:hypothetical protein
VWHEKLFKKQPQPHSKQAKWFSLFFKMLFT